MVRRVVGVRARRRGIIAIAAVIALLAGSLRSALPADAASAWTVGLGTGTAQAHAQALNAPTNVTATCTNPTLVRTITVSWTAVTHASYTIYQSTTSATTGYSAVATGVSTTSWTSGTLTANKTYWYEAAAVIGTNWTSPNSSPTTGRTIRSSTPFCQ